MTTLLNFLSIIKIICAEFGADSRLHCEMIIVLVIFGQFCMAAI